MDVAASGLVTVTVNVQVEVLPQTSVDLEVTVVTPALNEILFKVKYASGVEVVAPLKV